MRTGVSLPVLVMGAVFFSVPSEPSSAEPAVLRDGTGRDVRDAEEDDVSAQTLRVPAQYAAIQDAIAAANAGDTVLVAPGTYVENIDFLGKDIIVRSEAGADRTTIRGDGGSSVVTCQRGEPRTATIEGFTITGGHASEGGGILVLGAMCTIRRNKITNNTGCAGAGIGVGFGSPRIEDNIVSSNRGQVGCSGGIGGGGISVRGAGQTEIVGNLICDNFNIWGGGITLFAAGNPLVQDNVICRNNAGDGGGVWLANRSDTMFIQNLFFDNVASSEGGAIDGPQGQTTFVNNSFARNVARNGSCLSSFSLGSGLIFYNNNFSAEQGDAIYCSLSGSAPTFRNNNVWSRSGHAYGGQCPSYTGVDGNISADPLFRDLESDDFQLQRESPCIDAGNDSAPTLPQYDLWGDERRLDGDLDTTVVIDIGADEYSGAFAFGSPCVGSGGFAPEIRARGGVPFIGNRSFAVLLERVLGGAQAVLMVGSSDQEWGTLELPYELGELGMPGCELYVSLDLCLYVTANGSGAGSGRVTVPLPIPNVPALRGTSAYFQWFVADPGPAWIPGVVSAALRVDVH